MSKKINVISINDFSSILEYKAKIEEQYKKARNGKDPRCKKCNDYGVIEGAIQEEINGKLLKFDKKCECWSDEKEKLEVRLSQIIDMTKKYKEIFGILDIDMCFDNYSIKYNSEIIRVLKSYLKAYSTASLFLRGNSASGKTTLLKMLWQIYTINNVKVFYLKASYFEKLYKQLYSVNAPKNLQESINTKIDNAKKCDILLIDDLDSVSFNSAKNGYYEIFDALYKAEKKVIITSSNSLSNIVNSLKEKTDKESLKLKDRLISRMLGLGIIQIELKNASVDNKIVIKRKILKEA